MQGKVKNSCCVLDSLKFNVINVIKAASILIFDLLQSQVKSGITRSITVRKAKETLKKCQSFTTVDKKDFLQIWKLLDLEDRRWKQARHVKNFELQWLNSEIATTSNIQPDFISEQVTFWPSDAGPFPIFKTDTNTSEWEHIYEEFLASQATLDEGRP